MKDYYTIGIKFQNSSKQYTYKVPKEIAVDINERVVVFTTTGLTIVTVASIHETPQDTMQGIAYKWVSFLLLPVIIEEKQKEGIKRL